jgi:hemolysin activation/secretion protein
LATVTGRVRATALGVLAAFPLLVSPARAEERPEFPVYEYRVRGNTLLPGRRLEEALYALLGPGKSVADVDKARGALEQTYRDAGYPTVFVDVPEQNVREGVVVLAVTEGRIQRVRITGARYFANGWIREQVPEAQAGKVPRLAAFQEQLQSLNSRSADRSVTPVLRPGSIPGTVEVELKVSDHLPIHGSLEANNRNTANTSATRVNASFSYDNLWQRDHSLGFQYQVAPQDRKETQVIAGSYTFRPEMSGTTFAFYAVNNASDIATVGGLSVLGKGTVVGARMVNTLPQWGAVSQNLLLGLDFKDFKESIAAGASGVPEIQTPIQYLNWSIGYNLGSNAERRRQSFAATLNFGIRGLVNDTQQFANKRFRATANYAYLDLNYSLTQALPFGTALAWANRLQLSAQPLISNEQMNAGGLDSVRGYFEAEQLGDYGLQTSLEFQSPNFGPRITERVQTLYAYAFTDWAGLRLHEPLPDQDASFGLFSSGLGVRFSGLGLLGSFNWAHVFTDGATTKAGDNRWLFQLRYGF